MNKNTTSLSNQTIGISRFASCRVYKLGVSNLFSAY